jgi:site-specific DNA-methyltransferase (adenine-specific)
VIEYYNEDCMVGMKRYGDKHFSLAIVDPPYGIGEDGDKIREYNSKSCEAWKGRKPKEYNKKDWDNERPSPEYFAELQRVSKNQIIWGGNYFADMLKPTGSWIVWDKQVVMPTFSDGEMAWCSIKNSLKIVKFLWAGYRKCEEVERIHPTQKPVALYQWLLKNYAKPGDKILDTHGGSMSSVIACINMGFSITALEIDKDYFEAGCDRIKRHLAQEDFTRPSIEMKIGGTMYV